MLSLILLSLTQFIIEPGLCKSINRDNYFEGAILKKCTPVILKDFHMFSPQKNSPPSDSTKLFIYRTKDGLLYVFQNYAKNLNAIKKTVLKRDVDLNKVDDYDAIFISSEEDISNIYVFFVNPAGTQKDLLALNKGNGGAEWDGDWEADAKITTYGWRASLFIPYSDLPPSKTNRWRINFLRKNRSINPSELYVFYMPSTDNILDLSGAPLLKINNVSIQPKFIFLNPYFLGKILEDGQGNGVIEKKAGFDLDISTRSKTFRLFTSLRPDFNFIEADEEHIIFDDYGYYLNEKRQFFLMKQELYNNALFKTIYTRKIDSFDFGTNVYFMPFNRIEINTFVLQRDMGSDGSGKIADYAGILKYSARNFNLQLNMSGEGRNRCYDFISGGYFLSVNAFLQVSRYNNLTAKSLEISRNNDGPGVNWYAGFLDIPPDFNPPLGYLLIPKNAHGFKRIQGNVSYRKYLRNDVLNYLEPAIGILKESDKNNKPWRDIVTGNIELDGKIGRLEYATSVILTLEKKISDGDTSKYYNNFTQGMYIILRNENGNSSLSFSINTGRYQGENLLYPSASLFFRPADNLNMSIYAASMRMGSESVRKLVYSRIGWKISKKAHMSNFVQWSNKYGELLLNLIFQYRLNSRTYLYVAVNEIHRLTNEDIKHSSIGLILKGIAIKMTYNLGIL